MMSQSINTQEYKSFEVEIKLSINQQLFEKGHITEELYTKAKIALLAPAHN